MACAMGSIKAVVEVLHIHIDRNHVGSIKPSINLKHNGNNITNTCPCNIEIFKVIKKEN